MRSVIILWLYSKNRSKNCILIMFTVLKMGQRFLVWTFCLFIVITMYSFIVFIIYNNKGIKNAQWAMENCKLYALCTYQRPSRGVDPGDIRGNSAGFADFCRQVLARDGDIGPHLHFWGMIHRDRPSGFVTSPPSWKWKIRTAGLGI